MRVREKNLQRINRAEMALHAHGSLIYPTREEAEIINDERVIDLLSDLFHLCQLENVDINAVVRMAKDHYEEESGKNLKEDNMRVLKKRRKMRVRVENCGNCMYENCSEKCLPCQKCITGFEDGWKSRYKEG